MASLIHMASGYKCLWYASWISSVNESPLMVLCKIRG
jgi:hypothetical protein